MIPKLVVNIRDTLTFSIGYLPGQKSLIVYDDLSPLSLLLSEGYARVLPDARILRLGEVSTETIIGAIDALDAGDLVVLLESSRFPFHPFRFRLDLFKRQLRVIEHPHLGRIRPGELERYVDSLAYEPDYYRKIGRSLKRKIDACREIRLFSGSSILDYRSPFEDSKLNIGDYTGSPNIGGQFPIGEVFTEPRFIDQVNGTVELFAFGNRDFTLFVADRPFTATVERGILTSAPGAPPEFLGILDDIRAAEEVVWLRELGFGLNRAMDRFHTVRDISTFERMNGIHLSIGAKHTLYTKPGFPKSNRFHVDIFVAADRVEIDRETVFQNNRYALSLLNIAEENTPPFVR